jgi:hypothetical protein
MRRVAARLRAAFLLGAVVVAACDASASVGGAGTSPPRSPSGASPAAPESSIALPTLVPNEIAARVPTRVRVPKLGIDLPIVRPPSSEQFPYCDVAEYIPELSRPGRPGATYLYAHARAGMFLPILDASLIHDGRSMLGVDVQIYTSDDRLFTYDVIEVRRHVESLDFAYRSEAERLILQTSEGPPGTPGKTLLIAQPVREQPADHASAHPDARPVRCG